MYKNILVPLDGSANSERALETAVEFGEGFGAKLHLMLAYDVGQSLFVGDDDTLPLDYKKLKEHQRIQVEQYLQRKASELNDRGVQVEWCARAKNPLEAICEVARERRVDLILMTSKGRSALMRWVSGSVAQQIMGVTPCPVLVLRSAKVGEPSG